MGGERLKTDKQIICDLERMMLDRNIRSVSDIQRNTGLARRTLDRLYHNDSNQINYNTILILCDYLQCDTNDLLRIVTKEEYDEYMERRKELKKSIEQGFVYFFKSPLTNLIKIGKTNDVNSRLSNLEKIYGKLQILQTIESNQAIELEKKLHKKFAAKRVHGEWFSLSESEVKQLANG